MVVIRRVRTRRGPDIPAEVRVCGRRRHRRAKLKAAERLQRSADLAERACRQITQRLAGAKITERLVSLADPDARPIGKGELGKHYEFGYVVQLADLTPNTGAARAAWSFRRNQGRLTQRERAAAGPPSPSSTGSASDHEKFAVDGGFPVEAVNQAFANANVFVAGQQHPPSERSKKWLASYRAGAEAASATSHEATGSADHDCAVTPEREPGPGGAS
jgi:hypothetical protein